MVVAEEPRHHALGLREDVGGAELVEPQRDEALDVDRRGAGGEGEGRQRRLVDAPAAQQGGGGLAAREEDLHQHAAAEAFGARGVVGAQHQVEEGGGLRAELARATGRLGAGADDELRRQVLTRTDGVHLQRAVAHAHRAAQRDRDGVLHVEAARTRRRDHLAVPVQQHRPAVDAVRELGDHARDAAAPGRQRQHLHGAGHGAVLRGLVDGQERGEGREQDLLRLSGADDGRDAGLLQQSEHGVIVAVRHHDRAPQGVGARIVAAEHRCDLGGGGHDQRREGCMADEGEPAQPHHAVDRSARVEDAGDQSTAEGAGEGGDIAGHGTIVRSVESSGKLHTFGE